MNPVAGIDYSTKALDVAIVRGRELVSCKAYDLGRTLPAQITATANVVEALRVAGVSLVVMETPWMREGAGMGAAMVLHRVVTRVECLAVFAGLGVRFVAVSTWRKEVLGRGDLRTDAAKAAAIRYVEMVYRTPVASHNAADSVCLATWLAGVAAREERMAV